MNALASTRLGRIALHLIAMTGDLEFTFHLQGILRECKP